MSDRRCRIDGATAAQGYTEARVNDTIGTLRLLLISADARKSALLKQTIGSCVTRCKLRRIDPGPGALASATNRGPHSDQPPPHIILLDVERADAAIVGVAKKLATDVSRPPVPLVLLTTAESENELRNGRLPIDDSRVFEATSLAGFAGNLARHKPKRFLRALAILSDLGPVLVRMPGNLQQATGEPAA